MFHAAAPLRWPRVGIVPILRIGPKSRDPKCGQLRGGYCNQRVPLDSTKNKQTAVSQASEKEIHGGKRLSVRGVEVNLEPVTEKSSKSASAMYLYIGTCTNSLREFRERLVVSSKKKGRKKKNGSHSRARTYILRERVCRFNVTLNTRRDSTRPGISRCAVSV